MNTTSLRVARCSIGHEKYFVDLGGVASIQQSNVVRQLPTAEQPIGQLDTAQGPIPVFSLSLLLHGEFQTLSSRAYCLIIHRDGRRWGLMVDHIQQSTELTDDRLMRLPHDLHADWCVGAALSDESVPTNDRRILLVLNPAAIDGQSPLTFSTRATAADRATEFVASRTVTSVRQLLLFELARETDSAARTSLAFNSAQVMEISGSRSVTPLPHAPTGVLGLIEWRGRSVPLLNLSTTLGLPEHTSSRLTRFVIVRRAQSDEFIAFVAPSTIRTQVLEQNQTTRRNDLNLDESRFFGAFSIGDETLLVPNLDRILSA